MVAASLGLANSGSRSEDRFWEHQLARLLDRALDAAHTATINSALERLNQTDGEAYGALVESVLMRYPGRVTMCISSQAGCGMNCPFCATGQQGLTRNLSTAEIVEQVIAAARALRHGDLQAGTAVEHGHEPDAESTVEQALRVSNVVFMGMGEALANYRAAIGAIRRLVEQLAQARRGPRDQRDLDEHHRLVGHGGVHHPTGWLRDGDEVTVGGLRSGGSDEPIPHILSKRDVEANTIGYEITGRMSEDVPDVLEIEKRECTGRGVVRKIKRISR
mgnify:CR=1 FL=1